MKISTSQTGSVMHILLVAIVLFGAITAVLTQSGKGGDMLRPEKAKVYAGEIINYANQVSQAVRRVMLVNDCTDTQISFERAPFDGSDTAYFNSNAPSDFSCHVYHPSGGGAVHEKPKGAWMASNSYQGWAVDANHCVESVGGHSASCLENEIELLISLVDLKKEICVNLNRRLGVDNPANDSPVENNSVSLGFSGVYGPGTHIVLGDTAGEVSGKKAFCLRDNSGYSDGMYIFSRVLLAR